jgi:hypothetical protein
MVVEIAVRTYKNDCIRFNVPGRDKPVQLKNKAVRSAIAGATGSEAEQHEYLLKELMPLIEKKLAGGAPKKQITAYLDTPVLVSHVSRSREIRTPNLWQNKTQTTQAKVGVGAQGCRRRRSVYFPTKKVPSFSNELAKLQQELHFEQPEPDVEKEELRAERGDY